MTKRTCDGLANRCMTVTYNFTLLNSQIIETKNCSSSLACDPQFEFSCKYLLARFLYLLVVVYNDNSTRIFSLYAVREQSLFCLKIGGEERKRRMQHKWAIASLQRDMWSREPHVTLTVMRERSFVLGSSPRIFEEKRNCSQSTPYVNIIDVMYLV